MTETEWHEQSHAVKRQAQDAELARFREWRERTEKRLCAQRTALAARAEKAAPPPPPADAGYGWKMIATPRVSSHKQLEERAHQIWEVVWHGIDFPSAWRVRWGQLDADLLIIGAAIGNAFRHHHCAVSLFGRVALGLAVMNEKIIVLDEANQRGRSQRERDETLIHELIHTNLRDEVHGPRFQTTLKNATAYYFGNAGHERSGHP